MHLRQTLPMFFKRVLQNEALRMIPRLFLDIIDGDMEFSRAVFEHFVFHCTGGAKNVIFLAFLSTFNFYSEINYAFQTLKFSTLSRTPHRLTEYK